MKKKLTLVIDDAVTSRAKRLAQTEGTTVSELVESYLRDRTATLDRPYSPVPGSWMDQALGIMAPFPGGESDHRVVLREILERKHA